MPKIYGTLGPRCSEVETLCAMIGAGLTGTETAVALAREGRDVTLVDMLSLEEIDRRALGSKSGLFYLSGLAEKAGVKVRTGLRAKEVTGEGLL